MILIFIGSYINVPCVINTIDRENSEYRILSSNREVLKFFAELYSPDVVLELPSLFSSFRNPFLLFKELFKFTDQKRFFLNVLERLHPQKIIFYYVGWNGFEFWLIKNFSRKVAVYYRPKINVAVLQESRNIRLRVRAVILSLLFGVACSPLKLYHYEFLGISKKFLEKIQAQSYPESKDDNAIVEIVDERFPELLKSKVLLLVSKEYNVEDSEYIDKMQKVIEKLLGYFAPEEIAVKQHPNFVAPNFNIPAGCIHIPGSFPANLLCYRIPIVISYLSATLFEAANLGKMAVSLLFIIESTHPVQAESYRKYLLANTDNPIAFPENFDEFDEQLLFCSAKKTENNLLR